MKVSELKLLKEKKKKKHMDWLIIHNKIYKMHLEDRK